MKGEEEEGREVMELSVVGGSLLQHERDCAEDTTLEGQSSSAELLSAQVGAVNTTSSFIHFQSSGSFRGGGALALLWR